MSTLGDLIQTQLRELGWSYAELARRCALPRSTVHFLATQERLRRMPGTATLDALSRGLGVPASLVREAAAVSAGISVYRETSQDSEVQLLIASVERLSADDRRHVMALVTSLLKRTEGS